MCKNKGAIHSVVFVVFISSTAARINDSSCSVIITSDGGFRGDKITPLKNICDQALKIVQLLKTALFIKNFQKN